MIEDYKALPSINSYQADISQYLVKTINKDDLVYIKDDISNYIKDARKYLGSVGAKQTHQLDKANVIIVKDGYLRNQHCYQLGDNITVSEQKLKQLIEDNHSYTLNGIVYNNLKEVGRTTVGGYYKYQEYNKNIIKSNWLYTISDYNLYMSLSSNNQFVMLAEDFDHLIRSYLAQSKETIDKDVYATIIDLCKGGDKGAIKLATEVCKGFDLSDYRDDLVTQYFCSDFDKDSRNVMRKGIFENDVVLAKTQTTRWHKEFNRVGNVTIPLLNQMDKDYKEHGIKIDLLRIIKSYANNR